MVDRVGRPVVPAAAAVRVRAVTYLAAASTPEEYRFDPLETCHEIAEQRLKMQPAAAGVTVRHAHYGMSQEQIHPKRGTQGTYEWGPKCI